MRRTPRILYTAAQVRELDRAAIDKHDIDAYGLMCRAGSAAYAAMRRRWPRARRVTVICGSGNNGGDGYVLARLARQSGLSVEVLALSPASAETAVRACRDFETVGGTVATYQTIQAEQTDIVVDAMLGTGLDKPLSERYAAVVAETNELGRPILALDIPTGLNADTGQSMGRAIRAEATITFVGAKLGLFTGDGRSYAGQVMFDDLEVPAAVYRDSTGVARIIAPWQDDIALPRRDPALHKGLAGRLLVVGGGKGMPGAVRMAGAAACRTGAGLVRVATHPDHVNEVISTRPELMVAEVRKPADLDDALALADVIAVGPGLGRSEWARGLLERVLVATQPLVMDADALNLTAERPHSRDNWVLTPHPGEAARLCGISTDAVQSDRLSAIRDLRQRYGGVIVLKGSGTLVNDGDIWICNHGNPGMASGGMGDVLTGIVGALIAQGQTLSAAARFGVWVHAVAADRAAQEGGEIGLLASDLLPHVRSIVNE